MLEFSLASNCLRSTVMKKLTYSQQTKRNILLSQHSVPTDLTGTVNRQIDRKKDETAPHPS